MFWLTQTRPRIVVSAKSPVTTVATLAQHNK